jgi:hypothetical protein
MRSWHCVRNSISLAKGRANLVEALIHRTVNSVFISLPRRAFRRRFLGLRGWTAWCSVVAVWKFSLRPGSSRRRSPRKPSSPLVPAMRSTITFRHGEAGQMKENRKNAWTSWTISLLGARAFLEPPLSELSPPREGCQTYRSTVGPRLACFPASIHSAAELAIDIGLLPCQVDLLGVEQPEPRVASDGVGEAAIGTDAPWDLCRTRNPDCRI